MSTVSENSTATQELGSIIAGTATGAGVVEPSLSPSDLTDVVAEVSLGDVATFADACGVARAAQGDWARMPAPERGQVLANAAALLRANADKLARLITREIGKPAAEAAGEVQEALDTCEFFLGEGRRLYGMTVPSEMPDKHLFTYRMPVGTVAVITAGNFPVAVPSWYIVPALLCGNTVVWKPAEYSAASAHAFAQLLWHAGVPGKALNLVLTDGPTTFSGLEAALDAGTVQKVGFTGSTEVGRQIAELCGRHLQSPCLELGGKNPMVVMPDADLDLAVEGAVFGGFGSAGQRCTSTGTVIVHTDLYDQFLERFAKAVEEATIGDPTAEVLFGPLLERRFLERFERDWLALIRDHHSIHGSTGTGQITGSNPRPGFLGDPERGLFCHPTIVSGVEVDDDLANTETFGPLVAVARFGDWDEAMALANGHGYGLSSAIYTSDPASAFRFRQEVGAGMVSVNNSTSGAEAHLPFGGNGKSGNGSRQSGVWVLDQLTRWQAMNWDVAGRLQRAQMDIATVAGDAGFRL